MDIRKYTILMVIMAFCSSSLAMPILCEAGIANNVSGSTGCQLGSTNNDFLNPLQVNEDQMFGFDDWVFGEKGFDTDLDIDLGLNLLGDTISGLWTIDDIWQDYSEVMLVIKGGQGNNTVPTYVGYLLNFGDVSGTYLTPFANANNGNMKDISHISLYVRNGGGPTPINEPSTLLLLGIGLFSVALGIRRRQTS